MRNRCLNVCGRVISKIPKMLSNCSTWDIRGIHHQHWVIKTLVIDRKIADRKIEHFCHMAYGVATTEICLAHQRNIVGSALDVFVNGILRSGGTQVVAHVPIPQHDLGSSSNGRTIYELIQIVETFVCPHEFGNWLGMDHNGSRNGIHAAFVSGHHQAHIVCSTRQKNMGRILLRRCAAITKIPSPRNNVTAGNRGRIGEGSGKSSTDGVVDKTCYWRWKYDYLMDNGI